MLNSEGYFICIEGLDKSGKTTQSILLVEALVKNGFDAIYTTEPSNGEIGKFIRRYLLQRKKRMSILVEALLFAADRAQHTEKEIIPMLKNKKVVVSDRYIYSSLAYQGAAGLDIEWIKSINISALKPDITFYLDIPLKDVSQRYKQKKSVMEWPNIQKDVKDFYQFFVNKKEMIPINGNRSKEEVARSIKKLVFDNLKAKQNRDIQF
jgi:dTMP kinase